MDRFTSDISVAQLFASVEADGQREAGTQALVKALEKLGDVKVGSLPHPCPLVSLEVGRVVEA